LLDLNISAISVVHKPWMWFLLGLDHSIILVDLRIFCRPGDVGLLDAVVAHEGALDSLAAFIDFVPEYKTKDPLAEVTVSLRSDSSINTSINQQGVETDRLAQKICCWFPSPYPLVRDPFRFTLIYCSSPQIVRGSNCDRYFGFRHPTCVSGGRE
jgi:hypothetical protein